jgi:hypothetical protein
MKALDYWTSCAGKIPLTGKVARKVAKRMTSRDKEIYVCYRCRFCGGGTWHVGHKREDKVDG